MKKLVMGAVLIGLGTACPKVERKVFTFDLSNRTGVLTFENIVTDAPAEADADFMKIIDEVIEGTKLEEEHTGWRIVKKELYDNDGRLDGKVEFTFDDPGDAGLYKHDKKSPYLWCASRSEEQTLIATNGKRIDDVLPGCVAWDRKATRLSVTVRTSTLMGGEQPLVDSFQRWKAGEKLERGENPFGESGNLFGEGLASDEALAEAFAGSLVSGMADGMLEELKPEASTFGPVDKADAMAEAVFTPVSLAALKLCAASAAKETGKSFAETLVVTVQPGGKLTTNVEGDAPDLQRSTCYDGAFDKSKPVETTETWTARYPIGITLSE